MSHTLADRVGFDRAKVGRRLVIYLSHKRVDSCARARTFWDGGLPHELNRNCE